MDVKCLFGHAWKVVDSFIGHRNGWEWLVIQCERCGELELAEL